MHPSNHLYWFLFVSYRGVVLVLVVLVMRRPSSPKNGFRLHFRFWRFCRFNLVEGFTLPFIEKSPLLGFNTFAFYRVAFVVLFPTKLDSLDSDFICKSYGSSGFTVWIWPGDGPESPVAPESPSQRTRSLRPPLFFAAKCLCVVRYWYGV